MALPILTELTSKTHFKQLLEENPGVLIIKFGAEWCGPCKKIEHHVKTRMGQMPDKVQSMIIDVDESIEVYSFLKSKKMVNGIPTILAYYQGNTNYIPDDVVVGADVPQVDALFKRCLEQLGLVVSSMPDVNSNTGFSGITKMPMNLL
jgi:thiol-disulfide isomerase/thioredoxin